METDDAELPRILLDERKTVDLCGHERDGRRCIRYRDHRGAHESVVARDGAVQTWE